MRPALVSLMILLLLASPGTGQNGPRSFPAQVERYLANARLTADDRRQLLAGMAIARPLPADGSKELAVFRARRINAPIDRYIQRLMDIEQFERGGRFKLTKRISSPPQRSDFARGRRPDREWRD